MIPPPILKLWHCHVWWLGECALENKVKAWFLVSLLSTASVCIRKNTNWTTANSWWFSFLKYSQVKKKRTSGISYSKIRISQPLYLGRFFSSLDAKVSTENLWTVWIVLLVHIINGLFGSTLRQLWLAIWILGFQSSLLRQCNQYRLENFGSIC